MRTTVFSLVLGLSFFFASTASAAGLPSLKVELSNPDSPGVYTVLVTLPKDLAKDAYAKWNSTQAYHIGLELIPVKDPAKKFGYMTTWGNEQASATSPVEVYTVFDRLGYYSTTTVPLGKYRLGATLKKPSVTDHSTASAWVPVAYGESKEFEIGGKAPSTSAVGSALAVKARALINLIRVNAELHYDSTGNSYGKTSLGGNCGKAEMFSKSVAISRSVKDLKSAIGKFKMYCKTQTNDAGSSYAIAVQTGKKEWLCADSTGALTTTDKNPIKSKKKMSRS